MDTKPKMLIPEVVLLGCKYCNHLWAQSRAEALARATEPLRCPRCGKDWFPSSQLASYDADEPTIVD